MDDSTRMAFNMKVLRRHDPLIEDIIESASYVVLYSHDGQWTKTGVEGPMFLYRRSASPPYGFFVLNRNGVDNFSANLSVKDDLELTTEFIIYRASEGDDDVVGIWIFEPSQRESVGQQMIKLQSTPITSRTPQPVSIASAPLNKASTSSASSSSQASQSISLDALFGNPPQQKASSGPMNSTNGLSLLESIFDSASPNRASAKPAPPPANDFKAAPIDGAEGLKAMLGLQSSQPPTMQSQHPSAPPSGLEALFASTTIAPEANTNQLNKAVNGKSTKPSNNAADIVDASLNSRGKSGAVLPDSLSRRDFVREVLSLIHTDKDFVDDLYERYLTTSH